MPWAVTVDNCKPVALRFPSKANNFVILVLEPQNLNGNASFFYAEELKPRISTFLDFCVTFNLDSKVIPIALPIHLAFTDVEKVFQHQYLFARDLNKPDLNKQHSSITTP